MEDQLVLTRCDIMFRSTRMSEVGAVYYLTIDECPVSAGSSQRRAGLHVDSPGEVQIRTGDGAAHTYYGHSWGQGCAHQTSQHPEINTIMYGGIYLASNMANTTRVWNCAVDREAIKRLVKSRERVC